jgi:hypothetical protein
MANTGSSGDAAFKTKLPGKRADVENDLKMADGVDRRLASALDTGKIWSALSVACRDLLDKTESRSADESFEKHTRVIEDVIAMIKSVGDTSKLTLDPERVVKKDLENLLASSQPTAGNEERRKHWRDVSQRPSRSSSTTPAAEGTAGPIGDPKLQRARNL